MQVHFTVNGGQNLRTQAGVHSKGVHLIWVPLNTGFAVLRFLLKNIVLSDVP